MNRIGRPRNTSGSLYRRRDSRLWWMSYRDHNGKFRQESTGERERGEAEKVMRKQPGVFHGFLPTPSFRCSYTVLGRLLSLATPTVSPLDGRVF